MPAINSPTRKDDLIGQETAAAAVGAQDFADVGRRDRNFAAKADPFKKSADKQLVVI